MEKVSARYEAQDGGDFMKCGLCIRFRDLLQGAPEIRETLDETIRAQAEQERSANHEVDLIRPLLVPIGRLASSKTNWSLPLSIGFTQHHLTEQVLRPVKLVFDPFHGAREPILCSRGMGFQCKW